MRTGRRAMHSSASSGSSRAGRCGTLEHGDPQAGPGLAAALGRPSHRCSRRPILVVRPRRGAALDGAARARRGARPPPRGEVILARLLDDGGALGRGSRTAARRAVTTLAERGSPARDRGVHIRRPGRRSGPARPASRTSTSCSSTPRRRSFDDGRSGADLWRCSRTRTLRRRALAGSGEGGGDAVLVPFGGVEHDWAAVELGARHRPCRGATLRLLGAAAVPEAGKRDASRLVSNASLVVQRALGVTVVPELVPPGEQGIVDACADAGMLVVGLSTRWHEEGLGRARLGLAARAASPVLFVRRGARPARWRRARG